MITTRISETCIWEPSLTRKNARHVQTFFEHRCNYSDRVTFYQLVFTYKLTKGVSEGSFGTHVASLAGVPSSVVKRADEISKDFAKQFRARLEEKRSASSRVPLVAQADFAFLVKAAAAPAPAEGDESAQMRQVLNVLCASVQSSMKLSK